MKRRAKSTVALLVAAMILLGWGVPALAAPAAPTNLILSSSTTALAFLGWSDNATDEDNYYLERKGPGDADFVLLATFGQNVSSYTDTMPPDGQIYYYRVRCGNSSGYSSYSNVLTVVSSVIAPSAAPGAPSGLTCTSLGSSSATLSWSDNSTNEQGYTVERRSSTDPSWAIIANYPADTTSHTDNTVSAGLSYHYRISCWNAWGTSGYSNDLTVDVPIAGPPAAPTSLVLSSATETRVDIAWTDNATNENSYYIERKGPADTSYQPYASGPANLNSYIDNGISAGTVYYYRVYCGNSSGSSGYSNELRVAVPGTPPPPVDIPAAPTGLLVTAMSTSEVSLIWTDNSTNETSFSLERKGPGDADFVPYDSISANTTMYVDTNYGAGGFQEGAVYLYRLEAVNAVGRSAYSNVAQADIPSIGTPPAVGTELRFYLGSTTYYVNGVPHGMEVAPYESEGRTMMPIRYVAEPLGASVIWNEISQQVTVHFNGTMIELWINNPVGRVDSVNKPIDPDNSRVVPVLQPPGRTMMPLRFIAENMGCTVTWNAPANEVIVQY